jgi:DNA-binding transcriptional ArsR family regulator
MDPAADLNLTFTALADGIRRMLIHALARGEALSGPELARQLRADSRTISRQLQVLERVGLIERVGTDERTPRFRLCREPLRAALGWIARQEALYVQSLDELDRRLSEAACSGRGWEGATRGVGPEDR